MEHTMRQVDGCWYGRLTKYPSKSWDYVTKPAPVVVRRYRRRHLPCRPSDRQTKATARRTKEGARAATVRRETNERKNGQGTGRGMKGRRRHGRATPFTRHRVIGARLLIKLARPSATRRCAASPDRQETRGAAIPAANRSLIPRRPTIRLFDGWDSHEILSQTLLARSVLNEILRTGGSAGCRTSPWVFYPPVSKSYLRLRQIANYAIRRLYAIRGTPLDY